MDEYEGFREFVRARLARLSRVAYLLTGDHTQAEDLLQSALVKVAARWRRVAAAGDPEAYVKKIIYHEHISVWRRRRLVEWPMERVPDRRSAHDESGSVLLRMVLEQALAKLTRRQRAVIVLRYFEDLSEAAAADVLGCSVGTVKSQTNHALKRLRVLAPELADLRWERTEVGS
ncbi:SigE family RNA polymerase sigma factor [Planosporangium mesophilum]|uniref:RNA polymerase sigma factor n=1 Tax=Planosporangium mesophilum TaxID=689768 RepID=A0A8J3WYS3_9ACTN|nr:SigE family RNA polymerase sigma factor [Planosporangium mesophilum]NJC81874.1 SigE family RNA polymerase sigma factor [Planosporangium mesophilum]GII20464.1 RNA polymerase sigma factor [Planosporangium mesophilum]